MSDSLKDQVATELARIEALPAEEQPEAYRLLQSQLERELEQSEGN